MVLPSTIKLLDTDEFKKVKDDVSNKVTTYLSMATMKADMVSGSCQLLTDDGAVTYSFVRVDFTGKVDDINVVSLDKVLISVGALVLQNSKAIAFRQKGSAAILRSVGDKLTDTLNIRDFGANESKDDNTPYIQAALTEAGNRFLDRQEFPGYGFVVAGGATVKIPDGIWDVGQLVCPQNVSMTGQGKHSTIIRSGHNGPVVRNSGTPTRTGTYDEAGMSFRNFCVVGDRTKPNQIGFAFLRITSATIDNLLAEQCGSHGFALYQAGVNKFSNIESIHNKGHGLLIQEGFNSWTDTASNHLPSNANVFTFVRCLQNDGAGIYLANGTNGNQFYGANAEYNYYSSGHNVGYNVHVATDSYVPNAFYNLWTEGPAEAHIYIACSDITVATKVINWNLFGNGTAGDVDRALIVNGGNVILDAPYGTSNNYKTLNGSSVPYRILNRANSAISIVNSRGSNATGVRLVDDLNGLQTGFYNNLRQDSLGVNGQTYGDIVHVSDYGSAEGWGLKNDTDNTNWIQSRAYYRDLLFGNGSSLADVGLRRAAAGVLSTRDGETFLSSFLANVPLTVAQLPSPTPPGKRAFVTDATDAAFNTVVVGGGSSAIPVFSDGTNWRVGG